MATQRKYTDAQREAMFSLDQQGLSSERIAARCREGKAPKKDGFLDPFDPSARSIRQILREMREARQADLNAPGLTELQSQALGLLTQELERIGRKQRQSRPLSKDEADLALRVVSLKRQPVAKPSRAGKPQSNGKKGSKQQESSPLEDLARRASKTKPSRRSEDEETSGVGNGRPSTHATTPGPAEPSPASS